MMRAVLLLAALGCTPTTVEVERPGPCVTYLLTEWGDTIARHDLDVPPENLAGVVRWWTAGCV